jgi:hypothetical protein
LAGFLLAPGLFNLDAVTWQMLDEVGKSY